MVAPGHEEPEPPTLGEVFSIYADTLTPGSKESNTMTTERVHARHFRRVIGEKVVFDSLGVDSLQKYVDKRHREGVGRETIHKELSTLRIVWTWAFKRRHVTAPLIWKIADLTLPKADERPPFQTWEQITRRIERNGLTEEDQAELWECLWLDQQQTCECLAWVRENGSYSFIYPMFAFAAYTGARRSELAVRSEREMIGTSREARSRSARRRPTSRRPSLGATCRFTQTWPT